MMIPTTQNIALMTRLALLHCNDLDLVQQNIANWPVSSAILPPVPNSWTSMLRKAELRRGDLADET